MTTNRRTTVLLLCTLLVSGAAAAEQAAPDPLQLVPPESLFCVKINNLDSTLGQLDQFLKGLAPFDPSMMVKAQLAQFLGSTDANSIDMSGDLAVFGLLPGGETPSLSRIGILVPVADYQKFVASNANVAAPDAQGLSRIGPEGQHKMIAAEAGNYALVTAAANEQALTERKSWLPRGGSSLAKRLSAEESKRAQGAPVWVYANIQTVHKMFGPMIQAKLQELKGHFQQMEGQGQPMMGNLGAVFDMYSALLTPLMQETQFVSLSLDPGATALRLELAMAAVPETGMAKALSGGSAAPDASYLRFLQNGAVMNFVSTVDTASWNRLNDTFINLLAKLADTQPTDEEVRQLKKLVTDSTGALGGTLAGSFSVDAGSKPPFALRYVVGLKDAQAFYRAMDQMPKLFESGLVADFYRRMGMKLSFDLQRKTETYKDVPIDTLRFSIAMTDPNSQEAQMIAAMYGQGMNGRLAVVNDRLVYAIAADPAPIIRELIDQVKSPGSTAQVPSEVQAARQLIPGSEKAEFFATYNYLRVLRMVTAMMPMPIPPMDVKSESNIAISGVCTDGKLAVQVALPKQHVQEIMGAFMQMQQQMQGQQQDQDDEM